MLHCTNILSKKKKAKITQVALHVLKCVPLADVHIGGSQMGVGGEGRRSQVDVTGTVALRICRVDLGIVAVAAPVAVGYIAGRVCVLGLADVGCVDGGSNAWRRMSRWEC
jgi:hypothetical protein